MIRVDSAGYQQQVLAAAERHRADVTHRQGRWLTSFVRGGQRSGHGVVPALRQETKRDSEIAEMTTSSVGSIGSHRHAVYDVILAGKGTPGGSCDRRCLLDSYCAEAPPPP